MRPAVGLLTRVSIRGDDQFWNGLQRISNDLETKASTHSDCSKASPTQAEGLIHPTSSGR